MHRKKRQPCNQRFSNRDMPYQYIYSICCTFVTLHDLSYACRFLCMLMPMLTSAFIGKYSGNNAFMHTCLGKSSDCLSQSNFYALPNCCSESRYIESDVLKVSIEQVSIKV